MKKDTLLFSALLVAGLGLLVFALNNEGDAGAHSVVSSDQQASVTFGELDSYRKEVKQKKIMETQKVSVENYQQSPVRWRPKKEKRPSLKLKSAPLAAARDIESVSREIIAQEPSLEGEINQLLAERQKFEQLTQIQKQNYVSSFKKEALRLGFRVEFNENLEVVEFRRIPGSKKERDFSEQDLVDSQEYY